MTEFSPGFGSEVVPDFLEPYLVPDFLTIEETARVLRIGRTAAYKLTRLWRVTDGKAGIPNIAFGATYRVPRGALEAMLGRRITHIPEPKRPKTSDRPGTTNAPSGHERTADVRPLRPRQGQRPSTRDRATDQGSLPV